MSGVRTLIHDMSYRVAEGTRIARIRAMRRFSRRAARAGFFDKHLIFFETSATTAFMNRLNERHRAIIEPNKDILIGARVLDIASHDGRWSYAALSAGASYVVGIEARDHLARSANENLSEFGQRFESRLGDAFAELDKIAPGSIDTVLCLGFFYHAVDHMLLLSKIARINPKHLILDTAIISDPRPIIYMQVERHELESDAARTSEAQTIVLAGRPSKPALDMMLASFGWKPNYYDWHSAGIANWQDIEDYQEGLRVTLRAAVRSG